MSQRCGRTTVASKWTAKPSPSVATFLLNSLGLTSDRVIAQRPTDDARAPPDSCVVHVERRVETASLTLRHLQLVLIALLRRVLVAVPLGLLLERARFGAEWVVGAFGVLQTIPSIALLAFMIPLLGVGVAAGAGRALAVRALPDRAEHLYRRALGRAVMRLKRARRWARPRCSDCCGCACRSLRRSLLPVCERRRSSRLVRRRSRRSLARAAWASRS